MIFFKAILVVIIFSQLFFIYPISYSQNKGGILGQVAPEFDLQTWIDTEGKETDSVSLKDHKEKIIYLLFFQDWCPGCQKYGFPTLKTVLEHFKEKEDITFMAIQTVFEGHQFNTQDKLKKNQETYNIKISMGHDPKAKLMKRYRTRGTPWVVIIGKDGKVKYNDFHISKEQAIKLISGL